MKYLLSSNRVTTDPREYVKDLIIINMLLRKKEIPYWIGGTDDLIGEITDREIRESIGNIVDDIIRYIGNKVSGVSVSLGGVDVGQNFVTVTINIDDNKEIFNLIRR